MQVAILVFAMVVVGALIGYLADKIFKGERPKGLQGDLIIAILSTVIIGLLDWFVIPAMGFKQSMVILGVIFEPALGAILILWLVRRANK